MQPGTRVADRYEVAHPLGAGGMGEVYEATDVGTGEPIALKIILSERFAKDPGTVKRFEREGRMMGTLVTPHIVRFLAAGRDEMTGTPFLAMELLQGEDLKQLFRRIGPLSPRAALKVAAQLCLGLEAAHEVGLVHRDVKPANVFATRLPSGEIVVKLLDFGVAKMDLADQASLSLSASGGMIGSPAYMSPEQALGHDDIDGRSDICSLGVLLYEALAGTTPFGERTSLGQVIVAICSEPPPRIEEIAPWVPAVVADVVHRAMAKRREARYQTAGELLAAIESALDALGPADTSVPVPEGATVPRAYLHESAIVGVPELERARRAHPVDTRPAFGGANESGDLDHTSTDPRMRPLVVRSSAKVRRRVVVGIALASAFVGAAAATRALRHDVVHVDPSAVRARIAAPAHADTIPAAPDTVPTDAVPSSEPAMREPAPVEPAKADGTTSSVPRPGTAKVLPAARREPSVTAKQRARIKDLRSDDDALYAP
ncbi:MAG: serine/threonine-protein kinase [Polyangiaceae bacterium]